MTVYLNLFVYRAIINVMIMEQKKTILRIQGFYSYGGSRNVYVSEVTEKIIKVVCNEVCETYYRRSTGASYPGEKFNVFHLSTKDLERFLIENGTKKFNKDGEPYYIWKSGFKPNRNSRGEEVKVNRLSPLKGDYISWLKENNYKIFDIPSSKMI